MNSLAEKEYPMSVTTHSARITGPVVYLAEGGSPCEIPLGPCLIEEEDGRPVDIVWGAQGQRSAALAREQVEAAKDSGHLLLL